MGDGAMNDVRLETGRCYTLVGFAMNDFELMTVGDVTTLSGESENAECSFDPVTFTIRPQ
jgi:hypothetical protein